MKKNLLIILIILLNLFILSWSVNDSYAFFRTGNDLIPLMQQYEKAERSDPTVDFEFAYEFKGYVLGVYDATELLYSAPSSLTAGQTCAVVVKYLNGNPELWSKPASLLIIKALLKAFPKK